MRLDLKDIIHVPGASKDFQFQLDLSQLEFYGSHPISRPVEAAGTVTNHAGALELTGTARSLLDLACDRCGKEFSREKAVPLDCLLAGGRGERRDRAPGGQRGGSGRAGDHGFCPRDGYKEPLLRRLQRAVRQVRCRFEPRPLRVQT